MNRDTIILTAALCVTLANFAVLSTKNDTVTLCACSEIQNHYYNAATARLMHSAVHIPRNVKVSCHAIVLVISVQHNAIVLTYEC